MRTIGLPSLLRVPLIQHDGPAASPVVALGQSVSRGDLLGEVRDSGALAVHAPATGRIRGLARVDTARLPDVPSVEIETHPDQSGHEQELQTKHGDGTAFAELADRLGLTDLEDPGVPMGARFRRVQAAPSRELIINGLHQEAGVSTHQPLLETELGSIIDIASRLHGELRARHTWLVIDRLARALPTLVRRATKGTPVRTVCLHNRYPQSEPVLLAFSVLGEQTSPGSLLDRMTRQSLSWTEALETNGILVLGVPALIALRDALTGEPLTHRVITVAGPAVAHPGRYRVAVGTPIAHVFRQIGLRHRVAQIIQGSVMRGRAVSCESAVVTKETSALLARDAGAIRIGRAEPCVRCGWCQEDCPVGLDPRNLLDAWERGLSSDRLVKEATVCIECGVCSYVCPSQLPLARGCADLKRTRSSTPSGGAFQR